MLSVETLLQPLIQVIFLVGAGALTRALRILDENGVRQLTNLVLKVTLPPLLFVYAAQSDITQLLRDGALAAAAGVILPVFGWGVGAATARLCGLRAEQASVVRVSGVMSNTAFVGIPVCGALWGPQGALLAAIYDQALTVPLLTLVPYEYGRTVNKHRAWREILFAPMFWGLFLGIAWGALGWELSPWVTQPLTALGNVTFPLALILVGTLGVPKQVDRQMARPLVAFLVTRLVLTPLVALAVVTALGLLGSAANVAVLQTAMPASVIATIMAERYGADANLAASGALLSYIFAILTLPLIASLLFAR